MINLSKKIIAFDLDGTLAESKQHLESDMAKLLATLAKEKIVVVITGGSFNQIKEQFLPYFIPNENDKWSIYRNLILLSTSGSQRFQYSNIKNDWVVTDVEELSDKTKIAIMKALNEIIDSGDYDIAPAIEGDDIIEDRLTQISMSGLGQHAPLSLKKAWDPDQKKRQEIKKILDQKLPDVNIIIGGTTTLDILPKGFDKAKGLIRLLNNLGLNKKDIVFIGDAMFPGGNDYSVHESGIESIGVSGPDEVKEIIKKWIV